MRRLCPSCKKPHTPDPNQLRQVNVTNDPPESLKIFKANGCEKCRFTGYAGRTAIYEIAQITDEFRRAIVEERAANDLKRIAIRNGMRPLRHDGWDTCKRGRTTIEEVLRVTMVDEILTDDETTGHMSDTEIEAKLASGEGQPDVEKLQEFKAPETTQEG